MKSELEKCMAGEMFMGDESITSLALRAKRLVRQLNNCDYSDEESKQAILKELFGSVGEHVMWILISIASSGKISTLVTN